MVTRRKNIVVSGNACVSNGQNRGLNRGADKRNGIELSSATNVVVDGNMCVNNAGTTMQQYGMSVRGSTDVQIGSGNIFQGDLAPIHVTSRAHPLAPSVFWSSFSTSVGTTGPAAAPPATPARYLKVLVDPVPSTTATTNVTTLYIPAYNST